MEHLTNFDDEAFLRILPPNYSLGINLALRNSETDE